MRRWPLFAAIAYVVLLFIGLFLVPAAPEVTASGAKLVRFYRDHDSGLRVIAWLGTLSMIPIVLLVAPIGVAAWRGEGGFPRWLAWITAVFAIEQLIETITVMGTRGFIAPGGPMNLMLGAGLFAIWVIAAGASTSDGIVDDIAA